MDIDTKRISITTSRGLDLDKVPAILAAIAARAGLAAALRAYDAGLNTPVLREPVQ